MDIQYLFSNWFSSVAVVATTVVSVGIVYKFYLFDKNLTLLERVSKVEAARAEKGLPSEVTITPEDLRLNPELVDILGITDLNNNVNVALETKAHLEYTQFQEMVMDHNHFLDHFFDYFYHLFFLEDIVTFVFSIFT